MSDAVHYSELSDALSRLGYTEDAAGYHGALCGALCVSEPSDIDLMGLLDMDDHPERDSAQAEAELQRLCGQAAEALGNTEMIFTPLLPDDAEDLSARVHALSAWCEGFLYGLSTRKSGLRLRDCSPEVKEVIRDFTQFTQAGLAEDDDQELEEVAYVELVEYIRVGVQLVFFELHNQRGNVPAESSEEPTFH